MNKSIKEFSQDTQKTIYELLANGAERKAKAAQAAQAKGA